MYVKLFLPSTIPTKVITIPDGRLGRPLISSHPHFWPVVIDTSHQPMRGLQKVHGIGIKSCLFWYRTILSQYI